MVIHLHIVMIIIKDDYLFMSGIFTNIFGKTNKNLSERLLA